MTRAVVLVSGGLDSATVLAIARERGCECYALSFDYGQRHRIELDAAQQVAESLDVPHQPSEGIPITYVPARNSIFLSIALGWAEVLNARDIFIGVNVVDYAGYPDCRPEFIQAFQRLANLGTRAGIEGDGFRVHAPLINLSKAEIIAMGVRLGVDYTLTLSCYEPDAAGRACGTCDSCRLRAQGFADAGIPDPTPYISAGPAR
jgi:7-cyano-7-deazaguanine synthase